MDWLALQRNDSSVFYPLSSKSSVGSSKSNSICLEGRDVPALLAVIGQDSDTHYEIRDYQRDVVERWPRGELFSLGDLKGRIVEDSSLVQVYGSLIEGSLREILKSSETSSLTWLCEQIRQRHFPSTPTPISVEKHLRRRYGEFSLEGPIESLLQDSRVTDILVQGSDDIYIEREGVLQKSLIQFSSNQAFRIYIENLLSKFQKSLSESTPFVEFCDAGGVRYHLVGPPVTTGGVYLSVRRPSALNWTLDSFQASAYLSPEFRREIEEALDRRDNILISGATGAGKTSLLKSLLGQISQSERIIVLEDAPEINSFHPHIAYLKTRNPRDSQLETISLRRLLREALRMRPDRIILGEVRGPEALDLLNALNTGHRGSLGSLHANSPRDALFRLESLCLSGVENFKEAFVRELIARNLQLIVHVEKRQGLRGVFRWAKVKGRDGSQILLEEKVEAGLAS